MTNETLLSALARCSFRNVALNDDVSCPNEMLTALRPWTVEVLENGEKRAILKLNREAIIVLAKLRS